MDPMAAPRWLDDVQQRAWRGWIDASRRIQTATERQLKDDSGLTGDDYEVLVRLSEAPDRRLRMSDLADSVTNSPSRLSQRIDRMARDGEKVQQRAPGRVESFEPLRRFEEIAPCHQLGAAVDLGRPARAPGVDDAIGARLYLPAVSTMILRSRFSSSRAS